MKAPLKAPRDLVPKIAFTKRPADGVLVRSLEPWLDSVQKEARAIITKHFRGYVPEDDHHGVFLLWASGVAPWLVPTWPEPPHPPKRVREAASVLLLVQGIRNALAAGETASAVVHAVEVGVRAERLNLARHVEIAGDASVRASNAAKDKWSKTEETPAERDAKYKRWEDADAKDPELSGRERSRRISNREQKRGVPGASFGNVQRVLRARSRPS